MAFNYSYRAFLITSLLLGCLVLFLISIKLSKNKVDDPEDNYDVVMATEDLVLEEQLPVETSAEKVKIETNRAYNQADNLMSSVSNNEQKVSKETEGKLQEMMQAIEDSRNSKGSQSTKISAKKEQNLEQFSNSNTKVKGTAVVKGGNKNTTISYRLKNRTDIDLPNPVYTCYGRGKVVINIEVNNLGKVVKNSYNKKASTTTNGCLIDAALDYAKQARFSTDASKEKQLGSITFNFPGQD